MAERYLIAIYEKITLPPDEADAYLFRQLLFQAAKTKDQYDMKSMERIADKYNGSLSAQQKEGMFFLDVVLSR